MPKSNDWLAAPGDPIGVRHPARRWGYTLATTLDAVPRTALVIVRCRAAHAPQYIFETWSSTVVAQAQCPACGLRYWTDDAKVQRDPFLSCPRCDGEDPSRFRDIVCNECGATTRNPYVPWEHVVLCEECERHVHDSR